jgi:hypothetical protein
MKAWEKFEELARRARGEPTAAMGVTARVLRTIRGRPAPAELDTPLLLTAGVALAAASVMAAVMVESYLVLADPLAGLLQPLSVVLP